MQQFKQGPPNFHVQTSTHTSYSDSANPATQFSSLITTSKSTSCLLWAMSVLRFNSSSTYVSTRQGLSTHHRHLVAVMLWLSFWLEYKNGKKLCLWRRLCGDSLRPSNSPPQRDAVWPILHNSILCWETWCPQTRVQCCESASFEPDCIPQTMPCGSHALSGDKGTRIREQLVRCTHTLVDCGKTGQCVSAQSDFTVRQLVWHSAH